MPCAWIMRLGMWFFVCNGYNNIRNFMFIYSKAYNADFDGDEMNGHFVQNRVAQCEAAELGLNY